MTDGGFFPELVRKLAGPPPRARGVRRPPGSPPKPRQAPAGNPCVGCPAEAFPKAPPKIPPSARVVCVGMGPGSVEEEQHTPFVGPTGRELRGALALAGLDPEVDVGYANLARCRPPRDDFNSPAWTEMEKRCWTYLARDLPPALPLALLGTRPIQKFLGSKDESVAYWRGLWTRATVRDVEDRKIYMLRHPAQYLRMEGAGQETLRQEFQADVARLGRAIWGEVTPLARLEILTHPDDNPPLLAWLTHHQGPWAFDIEAYDAAEFPSRDGVATDPCHPDFRVRGVAVAWLENEGMWLDFMAHGPEVWRPVLTPLFGSPADKIAFNGHYDEEGLVYPGWVPEIRNRSGDGMLALVAAGDGRMPSYRLERATVDVLKQDPFWAGFDKSKMRDASVEQVAEGAVRDAGTTLWLAHYIHGLMARGEYL